MTTTRGFAIAAAAAVALIGSARIGTAQTLQQRVEELEKKVDTQQKSVADLLGIKFHGVVAVDYLYDINAPSGNPVTNQPTLRTYENEKNSFILNLGNLHVEKQSDTGLGFVADLDFGKTADVDNNSTFFRSSSTGNGTNFFDARQFYLTYKIPVGSGISLKAGRFVTLAGEEVIKAYNNINYNVTNSILFGFAIPFTHTGLLANYAFTDQVALDLGIVNGWDTVADNNDGKTVHGGLTLAPDPKFTVYTTITYGPEQNSNAQSKRFLATVLATVKPTDQLTFILDYDYGNESNVALLDPTNPAAPAATSTTALYRAPGNAQWQGVAAYAVFSPIDELQLALRGEVFDDPDGVRTLFQQTGFGPGATFYEFTPTVSYKITDGLWWRNEYRHDESDKKFFPKGDHFVKGQDTLATELVYTF